MAFAAARHLPHPHIGMIDGNVVALGEGKAEQFSGGEERGLDHMVQREIGLERGFVEIIKPLRAVFRRNSASPRAPA